jgi:hypothetical protein
MQQKTETRLVRARAKKPRDLAAARHRSLLRARAALSTVLRQGSTTPVDGQALAGALQLGEAAAAELAGFPDTPDLRESDRAQLAGDHAGVENVFEARLRRLVRQLSEGRELGPDNSSPAELLAAYVTSAALSPPFRPPHRVDNQTEP